MEWPCKMFNQVSTREQPSVHCTMYTRLLHPKHLDGIWIGQDQYRLPLAPLNEFPDPWCGKMSGRGIKRSYNFKWSGKKRVPDMGEKWFEKVSKNFLDSVFFQTISPHCLGLFFFFRTLKMISSLYTPWSVGVCPV